jgi:hypothetical protein
LYVQDACRIVQKIFAAQVPAECTTDLKSVSFHVGAVAAFEFQIDNVNLKIIRSAIPAGACRGRSH